ncbi:MAG: DUF2783 domain-containing protein [Rhodobacteraceae bacterium]|nr:DUF2783 domain-containing protein [Paracoccaceae bacterium]
MTQDNLSPDQDRFYAALMAAHEGLSDDESRALNARLVLMMANQIGDVPLLEALLQQARQMTDAP